MLRNKAALILGIIVLFQATPAFSQASEDRARAFVKDVIDRILNTYHSDADASEKLKTFEDMFKQHVDTKWMGRFAMGRYYRQLNNGNKEKYAKLYEDYLIHSYVPRFGEFDIEKIDINKFVALDEDDFMLSTEVITTEEKTPILVQYRIRFYPKEDSYKIIDFSGEGISLINTQRSDFSGLISRQGVDGFLEKLEKVVKNLKDKPIA